MLKEAKGATNNRIMKDEDDGEAEDTTTVVLKVLTKSFEELLKIRKKQAYII